VKLNVGELPQVRLAWPTSSAYEDISAFLGNIAVPTLILAADQDRLDPLEQHEREVLPRIPGAKIRVIHNSGHLIPIDQRGELDEFDSEFCVDTNLGNLFGIPFSAYLCCLSIQLVIFATVSPKNVR
jgi:hypothetical protein